MIKTAVSTKALVLSAFCLVGTLNPSQNRYIKMRLAIILVTSKNEVSIRKIMQNDFH